MSPVDLSNSEWAKINAELPDVSGVCDRIQTWQFADSFYDSDLDLLSRVRISQACFRDAAYFLYNARYSLGQAIGVRKYFLDRSETERDNNHVLADLRSRFYADYVPLLLFAAIEHATKGVVNLLGLDIQDKTQGLQKKTYQALRKYHPESTLTIAAANFAKIPEYEAMRKYRNDWVHNQPQRVESILYRPARKDYILDLGLFSGAATGVYEEPDWTWDKLIAALSPVLEGAGRFLGVCANEWECIADIQ